MKKILTLSVIGCMFAFVTIRTVESKNDKSDVEQSSLNLLKRGAVSSAPDTISANIEKGQAIQEKD
ncbi:hypothetical protein R9C00_21360 [Flammeovirgaceae bacterium SG7u.111]|nr:hypothetical protein [Flammeovirgaceae bacterium SG7u.132]WPO34250.1 hypothetical protein R9C00_21360 [Flammeovirgaceae bacterium SG7u.111]